MKHKIVGALVLSAAVLFPTNAAFAQTAGYGNPATPPNVGGAVEERNTPTAPNTAQAPATNVQGVQTTRSGQTLPVTGGDIVGMSALGLGLVGAGAILARRNRTRTLA